MTNKQKWYIRMVTAAIIMSFCIVPTSALRVMGAENNVSTYGNITAEHYWNGQSTNSNEPPDDTMDYNEQINGDSQEFNLMNWMRPDYQVERIAVTLDATLAGYADAYLEWEDFNGNDQIEYDELITYRQNDMIYIIEPGMDFGNGHDRPEYPDFTLVQGGHSQYASVRSRSNIGFSVFLRDIPENFNFDLYYTPSLSSFAFPEDTNDWKADGQYGYKHYIEIEDIYNPIFRFTDSHKYTVKYYYKRNEHSIIYEGNGHTSGNVPVDIRRYPDNGSAIVMGSGTLVKNGYVFFGWNTMPDGSGASYSEQDSIVVEQDTTLFAMWREMTYSLTYDKNDNGDLSQTMMDLDGPFQRDENISLKTISSLQWERTDHEFLGWSLSKDGAVITDNFFIMPAEDSKLFAIWKKKSTGGGTGTTPTDPGEPKEEPKEEDKKETEKPPIDTKPPAETKPPSVTETDEKDELKVPALENTTPDDIIKILEDERSPLGSIETGNEIAVGIFDDDVPLGEMRGNDDYDDVPKTGEENPWLLSVILLLLTSSVILMKSWLNKRNEITH